MSQSNPHDGEPKPKKLLDQVRDRIRLKNYSYRTEKSYVAWIKRYILFHDKRHPREMDRPEIEAFLTHLAADRNVAPSSQNNGAGNSSSLHPIYLEIRRTRAARSTGTTSMKV